MKKVYFVLLFSLCNFYIFSQSAGWNVLTKSNSSIPFDNVFYLEFDQNGNLWGGTSVTNMTSHLFKYDGTSFNNYYSNKWVYDIKVDNEGKIWTLTSMSELSSYDGADWADIKNNDLNWYSNPLFIDGQGNKWANPMFTGTLLKYDGTAWTTYTGSAYGFPDNKIICISGKGDDIYFGTNDSGLIHFDGTDWETYNFSNSSLPSNRIMASCMDEHDSLWLFCGEGYLVSMKDGNWNIYSDPLFDLTTYAIDFDQDGNLWIAQTTRVLKFDKEEITEYNSTNSPLPQFSILTVKVDSNNKVWIGTRTGLFSYKDNFDTTITITLQPQSKSVNEGEYVEFTIEAEGESLTYQWQKDGNDIKYATTEAYQIASAKVSDAGTYSCIVKNDWGQLESDEAVLTVNTGAGINSVISGSQFSIYPNPNQGKFYISLPFNLSDDIDLQIYTINGQLVNKGHYTISKLMNNVNVTFCQQSKGLYVLSIKTEGENYSRIFSVE
ncbi:immunoglobulin domain-containing protein [Bacteroidota bacterium]